MPSYNDKPVKLQIVKQTNDTITFYTEKASLTSDMYFDLEDMR